MLDGYLNKCKQCCKNDAKSNIEKKKLDPFWLSKERERCRKKQSLKKTVNSLSVSQHKKKWRAINSDKVNCHNKVARALKNGSLTKMSCEICSDTKTEAHHDDYNQPLNVRWLCKKHHMEYHNTQRENNLFKNTNFDENTNRMSN